MTNLKLDFYSEVIIKDSCPNDLLENGETIKGKRSGIRYKRRRWYNLWLYYFTFDIKYCIYIDKKYIIPTGKILSR